MFIYSLSIEIYTQCYGSSEGRNKSCPVCDERLNKLAELLPSAHCSHSRLICNISGVPLDEHNQPMMLPNNRVYGKQVNVKLVVTLIICLDNLNSSRINFNYIHFQKGIFIQKHSQGCAKIGTYVCLFEILV